MMLGRAVRRRVLVEDVELLTLANAPDLVLTTRRAAATEANLAADYSIP